MNDLGKGMFAGMSAALLTGAVDQMLHGVGGVGGVDVFSLSVLVSQPLIGATTSAPAWLTCAAVGALLYGSAFALLFTRLPGQAAVWRGIVFASVVWLGLMLVIMPATGVGLFGLSIGYGTPWLTLATHLFFGIALGAMYRRLNPKRL
ncbi:MAG: hypothetical protein COW59_11300 [Lysobacterales bacterium CG17_big_fil_post_rev_8_21_14_2_50_64_11]|nr:MAG: hypothetical protein COW59_11300 [Xanthomonadales bacterium CG17_big_fil_post_rev_8_21_14_2_50_64_11]PIX59879.1 MAG: hypothetical protein COZ47_10170 [Xanthomonadales bacterium CG_4_10_14_3_um_filter_64_11]